MKTPIEIERALVWTYRDELPKQAVGGLTGWERMTLLGMKVDEPGRYSDAMLPVALGAPHSDALRLDHAVRSLEAKTITLEWARVLLDEFAPYLRRRMSVVDRARTVKHRKRYVAGIAADERIEEVETIDHKTVSPGDLLPRFARLQKRPPWGLPPVRFVRVQGANNKPAILGPDGKSGITKGNRYVEWAQCPIDIDPPAREIALARWEYVVWWRALKDLAESCRLDEHQLLPPSAPFLPWLRDDEKTSRILRSILPLNSPSTTIGDRRGRELTS